MIRGLYSAASGMQATSIQQDVTSHNLTHAVKPGYRREILSLEASGPAQDLQGPRTSLSSDFTPGNLDFTGNSLDAAINGPGFFTIQDPAGPLFTRNGNFQMNSQGELVTMEGRLVQGVSGPIVVPLETASIEILDNGAVVADGNEVDQLKIAMFQNPNELTRVGSSYFVAPPNATTLATEPSIRQGYRESSNTSVVHEMVQMISGLRQFEASQRALRNLADTISLTTRPK